jgi:biopolymer transport protein ExbB
MLHAFLDLMRRGGPVMWVLLAMSVVTLTLILERCWFWIKTNGAAQRTRVRAMEQAMLRGDLAAARVLAEADTSIYGRVVQRLVTDGYSEQLATAAVEEQRPRIDRYMGVLSTMVTAGPLVGLLGSVIGLISVFMSFSKDAATASPTAVGEGMAEALMNTAGGLIIAVVAIFPFNAFRVQIDHTLGRLEALLAAASKATKRDESGPISIRERAG